MAATPRDPANLSDNLARFLRTYLPARYGLETPRSREQTPFLTDDAVTALVKERHGAIRASLDRKIDQAKKTYEKIRQHIGKHSTDEEVTRILQDKAHKRAAQMDSTHADIHPTMLQKCPACGYPACVWVVITGVEMDEDGFYEITLESRLTCGSCNLDLDAQELALSLQDDPVPQTALYDPEDYRKLTAIDYIHEPMSDNQESDPQHAS